MQCKILSNLRFLLGMWNDKKYFVQEIIYKLKIQAP